MTERERHEEDVRAIRALVARQFASLGWAPGRSADWAAFAADFVPGAVLYPAARPAQRQSVEGFIERMKRLAEASLYSFRERVLGTEIRIFGNVAVALAGCEMAENETEASRGVEMLLLVKDEGTWRIVAQAWDRECPAHPLPAHLARAAPQV